MSHMDWMYAFVWWIALCGGCLIWNAWRKSERYALKHADAFQVCVREYQRTRKTYTEVWALRQGKALRCVWKEPRTGDSWRHARDFVDGMLAKDDALFVEHESCVFKRPS